MTSGHRSAHVWVVLVSAILAACVLAFGWIARSRRPVPEPLAEAGLPVHPPATAETAPGAPS